MVRSREFQEGIAGLKHRLDLIETVLLVSNPDSPKAAEAYTGLRKTIVQSLQATQALHAAIAQLDTVASASDDVDDIRVKIRELMSQYGVSKVDRYEIRPDAFERIGQGTAFAVTRPAYVGSPEMPPIQLGVVEAVDPAPSSSTEPEITSVPDDQQTADTVEPDVAQAEAESSGGTE